MMTENLAIGIWIGCAAAWALAALCYLLRVPR